MRADATIDCTVFDWDLISSEDFMGHCQLSVLEVRNMGGRMQGALELDHVKTGVLDVKVHYIPFVESAG